MATSTSDARKSLLPETSPQDAGTVTRTSDQHDAGWEFQSIKPSRLLLLFCSINMLNYMDRGMIASNGVNGSAGCAPESRQTPLSPDCVPSGIQGDFELSNFQDGLLPTAFLVGLLAASPFFAHASKTHSPALLMALGLTVWCVAVLGCAISWGLLPLLFCRMLVGVGEASFVSLAAPCISDCAPPARVSLWLACFYLCIPAGFALGFIYGGVVASAAGWRAAFLIEAGLMAPFILFLLHTWRSHSHSARKCLSGEARKGDALAQQPEGETAQLFPGPAPSYTHAASSVLPAEGDEEALTGVGTAGSSHQAQEVLSSAGAAGSSSGLWADVRVLLSSRIYMRNVLGYSAYSFVIGAYAFWAPKAVRNLYDCEQADALFGAITVVTGVGGTLAGGAVLDYLGSSLATSFQLMGAATLVGGVFSLLAFLAHDLSVFVALIVLGELFLFSIQSPANVVAMQSVPPPLRALAIAFSTIAVHVLGDVPSPPLLGALQDWTGNFRVSMGLFTAVFIPAACIWFSGSWLCNLPKLSGASTVTPLQTDQ